MTNIKLHGNKYLIIFPNKVNASNIMTLYEHVLKYRNISLQTVVRKSIPPFFNPYFACNSAFKYTKRKVLYVLFWNSLSIDITIAIAIYSSLRLFVHRSRDHCLCWLIVFNVVGFLHHFHERVRENRHKSRRNRLFIWRKAGVFRLSSFKKKFKRSYSRYSSYVLWY